MAFKLLKCPLLRGILGDLRATSLADLAQKLFFDVIFLFGVCGSQELYNSSSSRVTKEVTFWVSPQSSGILSNGPNTICRVDLTQSHLVLLNAPSEIL